MEHVVTAGDVLKVVAVLGGGALLIGFGCLVLWFMAQGWNH